MLLLSINHTYLFPLSPPSQIKSTPKKLSRESSRLKIIFHSEDMKNEKKRGKKNKWWILLTKKLQKNVDLAHTRILHSRYKLLGERTKGKSERGGEQDKDVLQSKIRKVRRWEIGISARLARRTTSKKAKKRVEGEEEERTSEQGIRLYDASNNDFVYSRPRITKLLEARVERII